MAWTTPPTFVDGNKLSAAELNKLSSNLEYLKGTVDGPNTPFPSVTSSSDINIDFWIRHKLRYCHYKATVETGVTSDALEINIYDSAGSLALAVVNEGTNHAGPYTYEGYADANALTVGTWYRIDVRFALDGAGGGNNLYFWYVEERSTA